MVRTRVALGLLLCCLFALVACSTPTRGGTASESTREADGASASIGATTLATPFTSSSLSTLETTSSSAPSDQATDQKPAPALGAHKALPGWEVESLGALDRLMSNADGHTYYHVFQEIPPGLDVEYADIERDGASYLFIFRDQKNDRMVKLFVFREAQDDSPRSSRVDKMTVDGKTYSYSQEFDNQGALVAALFYWDENGTRFLVHPGEPITPDVIRKYSRMKKVEFNLGKPDVGLGNDVPLIGDLEKIKSVVKANSDIRYHTGVVEPGHEDDLLRP